jgi:hypothetical protein
MPISANGVGGIGPELTRYYTLGEEHREKGSMPNGVPPGSVHSKNTGLRSVSRGYVTRCHGG